jgi:hypothetical protein
MCLCESIYIYIYIYIYTFSGEDSQQLVELEKYEIQCFRFGINSLPCQEQPHCHAKYEYIIRSCPPVLCMHVSLVLQQELDEVQPALTSRKMQSTALVIIHVVGCQPVFQQSLHLPGTSMWAVTFKDTCKSVSCDTRSHVCIHACIYVGMCV